MTDEYRQIAEHPECVREWSDQDLLHHYQDTRQLIETDCGMPTNALRMGFVARVAVIEQAEILRRMRTGPSDTIPS